MLSQEVIERFNEDGAIVLRNVFDKEWVIKVQEGIKVPSLDSKKGVYLCFKGKLRATQSVFREASS